MTDLQHHRRDGIPINRRDVLKSAAAAGMVGVVGIPAISGSAYASSHGTLFATDVNDAFYSIDPVSGTATKLMDTGKSGNININGNAYDADTGRFYFTEFDGDVSQSPLFFVDTTTGSPYSVTSAGTLTGSAASGTIYDGDYYYVNNATDDLMKVALDSNGVKTAENKVADITDDDWDLGFGDIVFESSDVLYFSAVKRNDGNNSLAGKVDISQSPPALTEWVHPTWAGIGALQLALADDGTLYGQDAADGQFYTIDTTGGALNTAFNTDYRFTDLSGNWIGCLDCDEDDLLVKYEFDCVEEMDGECMDWDFVLESGDGGLVSYDAGSFEADDDGEPISATFDTEYCSVWQVVKAGQDFVVEELTASEGEVTATNGDSKHAISFVAFFCTEAAAVEFAENFPSNGRGGGRGSNGRGGGR